MKEDFAPCLDSADATQNSQSASKSKRKKNLAHLDGQKKSEAAAEQGKGFHFARAKTAAEGNDQGQKCSHCHGD